MTTYLGKRCSFCLPRVPFVNCRQFMYLVISLFGFEGRIRDLIVSVPDHCLSFYFELPLLESTGEGNGGRNYLMINLLKHYVAGLGLEFTTPRYAARFAPDCTNESEEKELQHHMVYPAIRQHVWKAFPVW